MLQLSRTIPLLVTGVIHLFGTGCAGNSDITRSYVDPTVDTRSLDGVLVVGVARQEASRIDFEDAFARALQRHGANAVPSHSLGIALDSGAERFLAAATDAGLDTILITRYIGESVEDVYHPGTIYYDVMPVYTGYPGPYGGYYGHAYEVAYRQPVWTSNHSYTLITDLFATADRQHLYQSVSDTLQAGGRNKLRDDIISGFVRDMKQQGVLD